MGQKERGMHHVEHTIHREELPQRGTIQTLANPLPERLQKPRASSPQAPSPLQERCEQEHSGVVMTRCHLPSKDSTHGQCSERG